MATLMCPECEQIVESVRGHLVTHERNIIRGALVTGAGICPLSNTKIVFEKKAIDYTGECPNCDELVTVTRTEQFIGQFEQVEPFFETPCPHCTIPEAGEYCEECGQPVVARRKFWRVSDSVNRVLPDIIDYRPQITGAEFLDFDTETEASLLIENLPDFETGRYNLDEMDPGFYDKRGHCDCPLNMNPMTPGAHFGVHRDAITQLVTVTDNHVIEEEVGNG